MAIVARNRPPITARPSGAVCALSPVPSSAALDEVSSVVAHRAGSDRVAYGALAVGAAWPRRAAAAAVVLVSLLTGYATLRLHVSPPQAISMARPRANVDVSSGGGVSQVIDLTVGETQIVMVYNGELKL